MSIVVIGDFPTHGSWGNRKDKETDAITPTAQDAWVVHAGAFPMARTKEQQIIEQDLSQKAYGIIERVAADIELLMKEPDLFSESDLPTLVLGNMFTAYPALTYQEILGAQYLIERFLILVPYLHEFAPSWDHYKRGDARLEADCAMVRSIAGRYPDVRWFHKYQDLAYELAMKHYEEISTDSRYQYDNACFASKAFPKLRPLLLAFHEEQSKPVLIRMK